MTTGVLRDSTVSASPQRELATWTEEGQLATRRDLATSEGEGMAQTDRYVAFGSIGDTTGWIVAALNTVQRSAGTVSNLTARLWPTVSGSNTNQPLNLTARDRLAGFSTSGKNGYVLYGTDPGYKIDRYVMNPQTGRAAPDETVTLTVDNNMILSGLHVRPGGVIWCCSPEDSWVRCWAADGARLPAGDLYLGKDVSTLRDVTVTSGIMRVITADRVHAYQAPNV